MTTEKVIHAGGAAQTRAAINTEDLSRNSAGVVGNQERDRGGDFVGADRAHRDLFDHLLLDFRIEVGRHVRVDQTRRDAVHTQPGTGHLARERARHRHKRTFRRGVVRLADHSMQSRERCHVHDRAAALLEHDRNDDLRQRERAVEIRLHDFAPFALRHVVEKRVAADARVVDQCVDGTEVHDDRLDDGSGAFAVADVRFVGDQPRIVPRQTGIRLALKRLGRFFRRVVRDRDVPAIEEQPHGRDPADASRAAADENRFRHQRHPPLQCAATIASTIFEKIV